jgi:hypothetical protein
LTISAFSNIETPPLLAILPFKVTVLPGERGKFVVHRLVRADHEICFAVAYDPDRAAAFDTLLTATGVLLAHRVVVDIAHHINDLAGHFCRRRIGLLRLLRQRQPGQWRAQP